MLIQLLGNPTTEDLLSIGCEVNENIISTIKAKKKRSFTQLFGEIGDEGLDLLRKMLMFDPKKRISVVESLKHPYLQRFHNSAEEIKKNRVVRLPIDDNIKLSLQVYRDAIYRDIQYKNREQINHSPEKSSNIMKMSDGKENKSPQGVSSKKKELLKSEIS